MLKIENTEKRDGLLDIQKTVQHEWASHKTFEQADVDYSKEKYMATFCMPYANGTMHLGHAFTVVKADFMTRYKRLRGFNASFPFAFHGTGMPIIGSATKLREEIEKFGLPPVFPELSSNKDSGTKGKGKIQSKASAYKYQWQILEEMGVPSNIIPKFQEPTFWLKYFPEIVKADLQYFGCGIDFRRSFITTDMNPYFDRFVKWQFNHLRKKEKIKYGTRMSIFSPKDNQMCADHDRMTGEGVKPKKYTLIQVPIIFKEKTYQTFIVIPGGHIGNILSCGVNTETEYKIYKKDDQEFIMTERSHTNMLYQKTFSDGPVIGTIPGYDIIGTTIMYKGIEIEIKHMDSDFATGFSFNVDKEDRVPVEHIEYYEPEKLVISRTNSVCVVAPTNQWFIEYGEETWKQQVKDHISTMETFNTSVKKKMNQAVEWLSDWGCSRSHGLGSKLPWDDSVLIESLSDSTIYMAYYTVCHLIHSDIYGQEGISGVSAEEFTDEVWDYIFLDKPIETSKIMEELLIKMKNEFNYYYPFDLRTTGKDLINNHMTMCLYNHVAMWPDKAPKAYHINGHLKLNGQKMSKRTGNFMTIRQAVNKFSADAVRYHLAESVMGLDDADFVENEANKIVLKLHNEKEWILEKIDWLKSDCAKETKEYDFFDVMFMAKMKQLSDDCAKAYEIMDYRTVIKLINVDLVKEKEFYCLATQIEPKLIKQYIELYIVMLSPICPHLTDYLWETLGIYNKKESKNMKWIVIDNEIDFDEDLYTYLMRIIKQSRNIMSKDNYESKTLEIKIGQKREMWQEFTFKYVQDKLNDSNTVFPNIKDFCKEVEEHDNGWDKKRKQAFKKQCAKYFKSLQNEYSNSNSITDESIDEYGFINKYKQNIASILKLDTINPIMDPDGKIMKPIIRCT